jgi:hypothetical protein
MPTGWDIDFRRASFEGFSIELHIVFPFDVDADLLRGAEFKYLVEVHQHIVVIHLPEDRKEGTFFGATILDLVGEGDLEIAGIPDPCLGRRGEGSEQEQGEEYPESYHFV